jgi:hypothetical protein
LFLLLIYLFPSFLAALLSTFCAVPSPFWVLSCQSALHWN